MLEKSKPNLERADTTLRCVADPCRLSPSCPSHSSQLSRLANNLPSGSRSYGATAACCQKSRAYDPRFFPRTKGLILRSPPCSFGRQGIMSATWSGVDGGLVESVTTFVKEYMSNYDGSHDFHHIQRVLGLAQYIYAHAAEKETLDLQTIILSALLHDVGDKKYLQPGQDASSMVHKLLLSMGADEPLAQRVQTICLGVSYSSEIKDPARVLDLIRTHPELAVVQDADRIDAIGAVGIGRCFTFGGTKPDRSMDDSVQHFEDKLVKIQGMMKTDAGKELAKRRTERLLQFREWWNDEAAFAAASPAAV